MTEQPAHERVRHVVESSLTAAGFELVDIERQGAVLRITLDLTEGGIDLERVTAATRLVSDLLDDADLLGDRTTLEVSSPGIERALRTPAHFRRFVGTEVAVKTRPGTEGERRVDGVLDAADDESVVVAGRRLAYDDIERAHTVFIWPSGSGRPTGAKRTQAKKIGRAS